MKTVSRLKITLIILFAALLWYQMFSVRLLAFWPSMAISTLLLQAIVFWQIGLPWKWSEWSLKNIFIGLASALLLFIIFFAGNYFLRHLVGHGGPEIDRIYTMKHNIPTWIIALTIIFPIGSGEEIFWRALIQKDFMRRFGTITGLVFAASIYSAVHLPSGNPVLLLAAAISGLYWGSLMIWRKSVVPGIISHVAWDISVFVFFPLT